MNDRANYAIVGLFVLLLGGSTVAAVLWLSTAPGETSLRSYVTYMRESVAGLNKNASVKYRGVPVGRVADISIDPVDPRRVRLLLDVEETTPVKTDTFAVLKAQGITGLAYLELDGGTPESQPLTASADDGPPVIRSKQSLLVRLDTAVSGLLDRLTQVAANTDAVVLKLNEVLAASNVETTARVLQNVEQLTASLSGQIEGLTSTVESMNVIAQNGAQVSAQLPELTIQLRESLLALNNTASAIRGAAGDFSRLASVSASGINELTTKTLPQVGAVLSETRKLSSASRAGIETLTRGTLPEISSLLGETRRLVDSLARLSKAIERNPNMLIYGRGGRRGPGE